MDKSAIFGAIVLISLAFFGYFRLFASSKKFRKIKGLLSAATVIDLRSPEEFKKEHHPGSLNIPYGRLHKSGKRLGNKNTPLILYGKSTMQAQRATRIVRFMGFSKVFAGGSLGDMKKL